MKKTINLICIFLFFYSCTKKDDTKGSAISISVDELKIDPVKKKYIANDGSGHYSGLFSSTTDVQSFKFQVEDGKSYRIIALQTLLDYSSIELILLNTNLDTLDHSGIYYSRLPATIMSYNPHFNGYVYLKVKLKGNASPDLHYSLMLENIDDYYSIIWAGKRWIAYGDWRINSVGILSYYGEKTGIFRWLRLDNSDLMQYSASFLCRAISGLGKTKVGFSVNGSSQIYDNVEYSMVPLNSTSYVVDNEGNYIFINDVSSKSVWSSPGRNNAFSTSNTNEWRAFSVNSPSERINKPNSEWDLKCSGTYFDTRLHAIKGYFYIMAEDKTLDELNFDSFTLSK